MLQYILFDLDGTLTDPGLGITNSVIYALSKFGIPVSDRRELYKFIGPPLLDSFRDYYGFSPEDSIRAVQYYREYFKDYGLYENEVYDGIPQVLAELKRQGFQLVLATSKPEEYAVEILKHFHLDQYFTFAAGATMDGTRSKKADVIAYAMSHCGITDPASAIMVGDRKHDILGAAEHGLKTIGVLFGYGSKEEFEQAGAVDMAQTPADILSCIARQNRP